MKIMDTPEVYAREYPIVCRGSEDIEKADTATRLKKPNTNAASVAFARWCMVELAPAEFDIRPASRTRLSYH